MANDPTERQIQVKCIELLKKRGGFAVKVDSSSSRGWPDLTCVLPNGTVLFVELKTKTGKTSKLQDYMISKIEKNKGNVFVVRSVEQFEDLVASYTTKL